MAIPKCIELTRMLETKIERRGGGQLILIFGHDLFLGLQPNALSESHFRSTK